MKVAVSIPDEVFADAEALAKRTKQTRSRLYSRALQAYVSTHTTDTLTDQFDSVIGEPNREDEAFLRAGARTVLKHTEW